MDDLHSQINRLVEQLVAGVTELARRAAIDTLSIALGGARGPSPRALGAVSGKKPKGAKRDSSEIEETMEMVHAFIKENPGTRIEQANKALGTASKDLALPLQKLIASGAVRTEGQRRGTLYFPGTGEAPRKKTSAPKKAKARGKQGRKK